MNWVKKSVNEMQAYVPGEQPVGEGIVKLNTNENPWLCTPEVRDVLSSLDPATLAKYPDPLCTDVRRVIAQQHGVDVEQVFAGNGSDEILALCLRAFVERAGSAGWFDPSYSLYPTLACIEEIEARPVALDDDFGWQMPDGYCASLFFLTNPNAPTGMLFPKKKIESFVAGFDGVVVIDEAYVDFAREDCMELAVRYPNVLVVRTLSKSYALAGIRFGYAVGTPSLIQALFKVKDSYNVNAITQEIARVALIDQGSMEAMTAAVIGTRTLAAAELAGLGFKVFPSETNFLWVRPPEPGARKIFEALRDKKIYVRWFDTPRTRDYLRITIGTNEQMMTLIEVLEGILGRDEAAATER